MNVVYPGKVRLAGDGTHTDMSNGATWWITSVGFTLYFLVTEKDTKCIIDVTDIVHGTFECVTLHYHLLLDLFNPTT